MKTQKLLITITAAAALTLIAGCDNNKAPEPAKDATNAVNAVATEAAKAVESAAPAAEKAVTDAKAAVATTADSAVAKANAIIDQAKALIGQNKYTEALTSLQGLAGTALNADQEKIVAGLKEQIQKAMAAKTGTDAAAAAGSLLKK